MTEIEEEVRRIIIETANLNIPRHELNEENDLTQMGLDSITGIKIIVAIENQFDFEFDDSNLNVETFKNIKQLCTYVQNKLEEIDRKLPSSGN
ncbi:phosphopantetheine-binding protein [Paenibacillus oleatilyticus]|uniref:Phosphopantetheine-binding protein n=1 Tax=Paenibacillus oleatilyticus TaxID=2594886 RepID=A0ABV4VA60_9BACL